MTAPLEPPRQVFTAPTGTRTFVLRVAVPVSAMIVLLVAVALVLAGTAGPSLPRLLGLPDTGGGHDRPHPTAPAVSASSDDRSSRDPASRSAPRPTSPPTDGAGVSPLAGRTSAPPAPATTAATAASTTAGVSSSTASSAPAVWPTSSPSGSGATNRATPTTRPTTRPTEPPGHTRTAPMQP
ncbi:MAG TPA: hypothetical protein VFX33_09130 [Actinomycetales bacterium]|nr:hypothetical protein [Actinomycetales bacterium]